MGRDVVFSIENKLRQIVHSSDLAPSEAFKHFDKDEDGAITRDELAAGLRELPGLEDITNADAGGLARLYDDDGYNQISLEEFTRQLGSSGKVGEAETAVLASLRSACAKSGRSSFQEALEKRGSSVDEACLSEAMNVIGAVGTSSEQRRLVLERFGGRPSIGVVTAFAKRGGVGSPDEIAADLGEPSASPPTPPLTIMAHPAPRDPALRAFADLLLAFEDDGADLAVAFRKLDTDRSGAVDARQLRSGLKSLGKTFAHFSDDDARRVVKALDKDNSGDLDLVELRKFVRLAREARDGPQEVDSDDADHLGDLLISFEDQGGDVDGFIARLDRNGDGRVTGDELYRGLRGLGEAFDSLDKKHARALVRSLDADDSGGIDARELRSFVDQHRKKNGGSIIKKGDSPDLVREKLRALLLRTEQKGTSLSSVFHALDEDDSGALSVNELLSGLIGRRRDVRPAPGL